MVFQNLIWMNSLQIKNGTKSSIMKRLGHRSVITIRTKYCQSCALHATSAHTRLVHIRMFLRQICIIYSALWVKGAALTQDGHPPPITLTHYAPQPHTPADTAIAYICAVTIIMSIAAASAAEWNVESIALGCCFPVRRLESQISVP